MSPSTVSTAPASAESHLMGGAAQRESGTENRERFPIRSWLARRRAAGKGLACPQAVPRLVVGGRLGQAHLVALDPPLRNADIDRAALHAGWAALAPVAQIALGEGVALRVVADARLLVER